MLIRIVLVALALAAQTAILAGFPSPLAPERPVSQRLFGAAAGDQQTLAVASNGQIAFAVWFDQRRGPGQYDLYGSRIDLSGVSLDPTGMCIDIDVTGGTVIWNGSAFVVVSEHGPNKTLTFIAPDAVQVEQKSLQFGLGTGLQPFATSMGSGPETRILFAGQDFATIVDGHGDIVAANVKLPSSNGWVVAASNKSEFLILRFGAAGNRLFADRLDRDGRLISTADTGVDPSTFGFAGALALAGGGDNYLLAGRGPAGREVVTVFLDPSGVAKSPPWRQEFFDATYRVAYPPAKPAIILDGDVYALAWTTSTADGLAYTTIAELPAIEGGVVTLQLGRPLRWTGTGYGSVLGMAGTHVILISDAFRGGISTTIDPIATVLDGPYGSGTLPFALSDSVTRQAAPQVASSADNYATVWDEYGPDGAAHLYLRRFSPAGAPIDPAPIDLAHDDSGHAIPARIAAAGGVYVIAWSVPDGAVTNYVLRRLSATTGYWIDTEPVPLAANVLELTLGASDASVLAAYTVECPSQRCMHTRAISMDSGAALRTAETSLASPASDIVIGSNGTGFLVAYTDNDCFGMCDVIFPYSLFVQRLGANGAPLGGTLALDKNNFLDRPSIAWSGTAYVTTWEEDRGGTILAVRITANGEVAGPKHTVQLVGTGLFQAQRIVATGSGLLLLITRSNTTEGITLDAESLAATGPPFTLRTEQLASETFSVAALPNGVVIAYDRADADSGNVQRVFSRVFGDTPRRRAAR